MLLRRYRRQLFSTAGAFTWYRPDGVTAVDVTVCGGGAGGGSVPLAANGGAGGGGSGWREVVQNFPVTADVSGVVGAGGAGGTAARDDACTVYQGIAYFIDTAAVGGDVGKNLQALAGNGPAWPAGTTVSAVNTTSRTDNTITLTTGNTTFTDASAVAGDVGCIVTDSLSAFAVGTYITAVNAGTHVVTVNTAITGAGGTANVTLHPTVQASANAWVWAAPSSLIVGGRVDASCGTTFGSATVTDAAILARDVGKTVTGAGIPANTFVGTVTAGVSFLLSSSATSQVNVTATATGNPVSLTLGGGGSERTDTSPPFIGLQGGTKNVIDTRAVAGDVNKAITGTGIARGTTVSAVTSIGYTLNQNCLGSTDGSQNCTVAFGLAGTGTNGTDSSFGTLVAKGGGGGGAGGLYTYAKNGNNSGPSTGGNAIIGYVDTGLNGPLGAGGGGGGGSGGAAPYIGGGTKGGGCTGGSYGAGGRSDNSNLQFSNGAGGGGSGGAGGIYPRQDDACTSTNASPTVTDTHIVLADVGQPFDDVQGFTFDNCFVGPTTYNTSFNASSTTPTYTAQNALVAYPGNLIIQVGWSQNGGTGGSRVPQPGGGGGNGPGTATSTFGCGGVGLIGGLANVQTGNNWIQTLDALPGSGAGGGAGLGTPGGAGAAGYVAVGWWEDL